MRKKMKRVRAAGSLFEGVVVPRLIQDPKTVAAVVDLLAQMLLEAARPKRAVRDEEGADDEPQDHG